MTSVNKVSNTQRLVMTAMMVALATALSFVPIWKMPLGGSVTLLSMLPIVIVSIRYGLAWGMLSGFTYSFIQLGMGLAEVLAWGLSPMALVGTIVFDYVLAYSVLGLSGLFRHRGNFGICAGIFIALLLRFVCHLISGVFIFASFCPEGWNVVWYSVCYNGAYMLPEIILTMIGAVLLFQKLKIV